MKDVEGLIGHLGDVLDQIEGIAEKGLRDLYPAGTTSTIGNPRRYARERLALIQGLARGVRLRLERDKRGEAVSS